MVFLVIHLHVNKMKFHIDHWNHFKMWVFFKWKTLQVYLKLQFQMKSSQKSGVETKNMYWILKYEKFLFKLQIHMLCEYYKSNRLDRLWLQYICCICLFDFKNLMSKKLKNYIQLNQMFLQQVIVKVGIIIIGCLQ